MRAYFSGYMMRSWSMKYNEYYWLLNVGTENSQLQKFLKQNYDTAPISKPKTSFINEC